AKFRGTTGEVLLQTLERRLDNALFRSGFAKTRQQARQLVSHRHILLNGSRVSIPSILVKEKDVIEPYKNTTLEFHPETAEVDWLKVDKKSGKITVKRLPEGTDLPIEFDTQKIIEFYSR
ncbi:MAG: 30S ribosomal protein S4, partial [Patescibacteria group bacterium]